MLLVGTIACEDCPDFGAAATSFSCGLLQHARAGIRKIQRGGFLRMSTKCAIALSYNGYFLSSFIVECDYLLINILLPSCCACQSFPRIITKC